MRLKKNIAISETGFVFDPSTGDSFTLNPMGLEILEMIRAGQTQPQISEVITSKYDVDQTSFERYFYDFIATLKLLNLLESNE